ncbi:MAG: glutamate ABC transporter substrate-binding protein [Demequina sp.]
MMRSGRLVALSAAAALVLSACGGAESGIPKVDPGDFPADSTMAQLAQAETITIGTTFDVPLFGHLTDEGTLEGFDVEIATIIASELGIAPDQITWVETLASNRALFIEGGQVDIAVATYTINDERKQTVSFAGPYYIAGQALMVRSSNDEVTGPEDLAGLTVCTVEESTPAEYVRTNYPSATLVLFGSSADCLEPLRRGDVDVVTTDNVILAGYLDQLDGEFAMVGDAFTEEPYGIALDREDTEFRMWINDVLEQAYDDGRWLEAWRSTAGTVLPEHSPPAVDRYELG